MARVSKSAPRGVALPDPGETEVTELKHGFIIFRDHREDSDTAEE